MSVWNETLDNQPESNNWQSAICGSVKEQVAFDVNLVQIVRNEGNEVIKFDFNWFNIYTV